MSINDTELLKEFAVESQEHLADIETQLLTLESQGENMDIALVNTVFRAIHSIKGAAGFMGLDVLGELAHRAEEVLNRLRNNELRPTSVVINTLLRSADRLKELIDNIESSNNEDVSVYLTALEQILAGEVGGMTTLTGEALVNVEQNLGAEIQSANLPSIDLNEAKQVSIPADEQSRQTSTTRDFLIECTDCLEQLERDLLCLETSPNAESVLNNAFRSMHTIKGSAGCLGFNCVETLAHCAENVLSSIRNEIIPFDSSISDLMFKTVDGLRRMLQSIESTGTENAEESVAILDKLNRITQQCMLLDSNQRQTTSQSVAAIKTVEGATIVSEVPPDSTNTPRNATAKSELDKQLPPTMEAPSPSSTATKKASSPSSEVSAAESTIRVDVGLLDKLMTRVGELVLARNQILQFTKAVKDTGLHNATQRLNLITSELQEGVMKTRMQPIGNVWTKFPRLVRDLAATCEKEVRIEMEGKETELDKTIIEAIKDPLTHLVRNTVDHGIEKPEVRKKNGKPTEGCLILKAYHEGGQVNIEIVDDGAGLNISRIKEKAVEKGLITPDQSSRLGDHEACQLIFLPGFSTAEKVSSVSGRGVGMDVVKTNIEKIGGTVDLNSHSGIGTTIRIKIPLTLAIIPALVITSDKDRYAIPQVNLLELVRLEGEKVRTAIEWIQGAPVYRLRDKLLPLVSLRGILGHNDDTFDEHNEAMSIVVLRADKHNFGLVVDKINDSEEIVVKPLSKQMKGVSIYSGSTIMGDGRVSLILDVMALAQASKVLAAGSERPHMESVASIASRKSSRRSLLIHKVGENRRLAFPLDQVTRLERLDSSSLEYSGTVEVIQYRGEILPLIRLANVLGVEACPPDKSLVDVIVHTSHGNSIGIIVDEILDVVECETFDKTNASMQGRDSLIIHGQVTNVLDLPSLIENAGHG